MYWALCTLKPKKPLKKFQKNLGFFQPWLVMVLVLPTHNKSNAVFGKIL